MAYVTKDQIAAARELDLLTYLQRYMRKNLSKPAAALTQPGAMTV